MHHIAAAAAVATTLPQSAGPRRLRSTAIAASLGVPEAALVATRCGESAVRLHTDDWVDLVAVLDSLGPCFAFTPSDSGFLETAIVYRRIAWSHQHAMVSDGGSTLVLRPQQWTAGYAVTESTPWGWQRSLQFFGEDGDAAHKVFLRPDAAPDAFTEIAERFCSVDQSPLYVSSPWRLRRSADELVNRAAKPIEANVALARIEACCADLRQRAVSGVAARLFAGHALGEHRYVGPIASVTRDAEWIEVRGEQVTFAARLSAIGATDELIG